MENLYSHIFGIQICDSVIIKMCKVRSDDFVVLVDFLHGKITFTLVFLSYAGNLNEKFKGLKAPCVKNYHITSVGKMFAKKVFR